MDILSGVFSAQMGILLFKNIHKKYLINILSEKPMSISLE